MAQDGKKNTGNGWVSPDYVSPFKNDKKNYDGGYFSHTSSGYSSHANSTGNEDGQKGQGSYRRTTKKTTPAKKTTTAKKRTSSRRTSTNRGASLPNGGYRLTPKGPKTEEEYQKEQDQEIKNIQDQQRASLRSKIDEMTSDVLPSDETALSYSQQQERRVIDDDQAIQEEYKRKREAEEAQKYVESLRKQQEEEDALKRRISGVDAFALSNDATALSYSQQQERRVIGENQEVQEEYQERKQQANSSPTANDIYKEYLSEKANEAREKGDWSIYENAQRGIQDKVAVDSWKERGKYEISRGPLVDETNNFQNTNKAIDRVVDQAIENAKKAALDKAFQEILETISDKPDHPRTYEELMASTNQKWRFARRKMENVLKNISRYLTPDEAYAQIEKAISDSYSTGAFQQSQYYSGLTNGQYWNGYVFPEIQNRIEKKLVANAAPKNWIEYALYNVENSLTGKVGGFIGSLQGGSEKERVNRQSVMMNRGIAASETGMTDYKPSGLGKFTAGVGSFMVDAGAFKVLGAGSRLISSPVTKRLLQAGATDFKAVTIGRAISEGTTFGLYSGTNSVLSDAVAGRDIDWTGALEKTLTNTAVGAAMGAFGSKVEAAAGNKLNALNVTPGAWQAAAKIATRYGSKALDFTGRTLIMGMGNAAEQVLDGVDPKDINMWDCIESAAEMNLMGLITGLPQKASDIYNGRSTQNTGNMQLTKADIERLNDAGIEGKNSYQIRQNIMKKANDLAAKNGTRKKDDAFMQIIADDILSNRTLGVTLKNKVAQALGFQAFVPETPVCSVKKPQQPDQQHPYWRVAAYDSRGRLIETMRFDSQKEAQEWSNQMEEIADKNRQQILTGLADSKGHLEALNEGIKLAGTKHKKTAQYVSDVIKKINAGEKLNPEEQAIYDDAQKYAAEYKEYVYTDAEKAAKKINQDYGYRDGWLEEALEKPVNQRTQEEQRAVEDYMETVKKSLQGRNVSTEAQSKGRQAYESGDVDQMRQVRIQYEESYRRLEQALQNPGAMQAIEAGEQVTGLNPEQQRLLDEYHEAKEAYDSMENARMDNHNDAYEAGQKLVEDMQPVSNEDGEEVVRLVERQDGKTYVVMNEEGNNMIVAEVQKNEDGSIEWNSFEQSKKTPRLVVKSNGDTPMEMSTDAIMEQLYPDIVEEDRAINDALEPEVGLELKIENEDGRLEDAQLVGQDVDGGWFIQTDRGTAKVDDATTRELIDKSERYAENDAYAKQRYEQTQYDENGRVWRQEEYHKKEEVPQDQSQEAKEPAPKFIVDEKGNQRVDTENTPMDVTMSYLVQKAGGDAGLAQRIAANKAESLRKEIEKLNKSLDTEGDENKVEQTLADIAAKSRELDYYNTIAGQLSGVMQRPEELRTQRPAREEDQDEAALQRIQQAIGAQLVFVDTKEDMQKVLQQYADKNATLDDAEATNGFFDSGKGVIFVNRASWAHRGANWIFGHESGHALKEANPKAYQQLKASAIAAMDPLYIGKRLREMRALDVYGKKTDSELLDEIVNDSLGEILRDKKTLDIIARNVNPTTLEAITGLFTRWRDKAQLEDFDETEKLLMQAYKESKLQQSTKPAEVEQHGGFNHGDGTPAASVSNSTVHVDGSGPSMSYETMVGTDGQGYFTDSFGQKHKCTRDKVIEYLENKGASKEDVEAFRVRMDYFANYFHDLSEMTDPQGHIIFEKFCEWNKKQPAYKVIGKKVQKAVSSLVKNGEYAVNLDLTTDCIKRESFTQVLNILTKRNPDYWRKMTPAKIKGIENILKKCGFQTACDLCFVEGKRLNIASWANNFVTDWNDCLRQYFGTEAYNNLEEFGFASGNYIPQAPMKVMNQEMYRNTAKLVNDMYEQYTDPSKMDTEILDLVRRNEANYEARYEEMETEWYRTHDSNEAFTPNEDQMKELKGIYNEGVKKVKAKMMQAIRQYPELRKKISMNDLMGSDGLMNIRKESGEAFERLYSLILSRGGTSTPKIVQDAEPYVGELLDVTDANMRQANKEGGARMHSFSDGDILHILDNMQEIFDADARKAKIQSYNKEIPFILQFGQTGVKINMSMLPEVRVTQQVKDEYWNAPKNQRNAIAKKNTEYAGLKRDKDGNIIGFTWSGTHSITPEFAQQIFHDPRYNANCGAIAVGVGVNHAIWLCGTDYIRQVIPFHLSHMPIAAREMSDVMWYRDFTKDQNTQVKINGRWVSIKGKAASGKGYEDYDFYKDEDSENWDMRRNVADYVKWCNEQGYKPRFSWCVNSENYKTWCKNNGFKPDQQVVDMMDAHTVNGVFDGYYKVITDFTAYQPEFDENGVMIGEKSSPHRPVDSSKLHVGEDIEELLYGKENSMLANREKNLKYADANLPKVADIIDRYMKGEITDEDIAKMESVDYGYRDDNDIYMKYATARQDKKISYSVEADQSYQRALEQDPKQAARIVSEAAKENGMKEEDISKLPVVAYDEKAVRGAQANVKYCQGQLEEATNAIQDFAEDLLGQQGVTPGGLMRPDNITEWIDYAPEQAKQQYNYLVQRQQTAESRYQEAQAQLEQAKTPIPLSERQDIKPKLTEHEAAEWLYKNFPSQELHGNNIINVRNFDGTVEQTRGRRMLGAFWNLDGSYNFEVAADDAKTANTVLSDYRNKLQNLLDSHNCSNTTRRMVENVMNDIDYAIDYYRQCATDASAPRRLDPPRFSKEEVRDLAEASDQKLVQFSFEGYKGAKRADELDMGNRIENLNVAKKMEDEGKDALTIRLATGWEKGADGEWKLETDNDVRFTPESIDRMIDAFSHGYSLKLSDVIEDHELLKAYERLGDLKVTPLRLNPAERGSYSRINNEIKLNLRRVVNQWNIYDRYKEIYNKVSQEDKDIVHWMDDYSKNEKPSNADRKRFESLLDKYEEINNRVRGLCASDGMFIKLNLTQLEDSIEMAKKGLELDVEEIEGTLNHEIQHYIQYQEGFSHGSNELTVRDQINDGLEEIKIWKDSSEQAKQNYEWVEKLINGLEFYENVMFDDKAALDWYKKQGGIVNENNEDRALKAVRDKASLAYWNAAQAFDAGDFRSYTNLDLRLDDYAQQRLDEGAEYADASEEGYMFDEMMNALRSSKKAILKDIADYEPNVNEYKRIDELLNRYDNYELYRRVMGEVESRNVQKRMYMSPGQRRKTLLVETEDIPRSEQINTSFSYEGPRAETFYSNAAHALEGLKQEKAKPEQWKAMLQKAGGLKAEEDKWIGLSDWLQEQGDRTVSKQEILDYINDNKIEIEDVKYSDNAIPSARDIYEDMVPEVNEAIDVLNDTFDNLKQEYYENYATEEDYDDLYEENAVNYAKRKLFGDDAVDEGVVDRNLAINPNGISVSPYCISDEIYELVNAEDFLEDGNTEKDYSANPINQTRLEYTTKGLTNKREIALKVPTVEPYEGEMPEIHFTDERTEGKAVSWARFGDAQDVDGNKVLVIDEIQSQRHQDARAFVGRLEDKVRRGYKTKEDIQNIKEIQGEYEKSLNEFSEFTYDQNMKYGQDWMEKQTEEEKQKYNELKSKKNELNQKLQEAQAYGVPDAPFRTSWPELTMKRMLQYAAEHGYDKIAWTGGEQQAKRYNLTDVFDYVDCYKEDDGTYAVKLYQRDYDEYLEDQEPVWSDSDIKEEDLPSIFGKSLASQIVSECDSEMGFGTIEYDGTINTDELKGMQAFYDQMLPKFMNKYCKKFGTKVETVKLNVEDPDGQEMWSVNVTPEMRETVLEQGQPMFSRETPGLPHMGSKQAIADRIVKDLPEAEHFYDLFGGGGAMAQRAFESGKYKQVHISDSDGRAMRLLTGAISGAYDNETRWISRDEFNKLKESDPYAAFAFSYWSNGQDYMYGKAEEAEKHALHQAIVEKNYEPYKEMTGIDLSSIDPDATLEERYQEARYLINDPQKSRLQSLDNLLRIQNMKNADLDLDVKVGDYRAMNIEPGSVVYADIPYEGTHGYTSRTKTEGFDQKDFRNWVAEQKAQGTKVYISGYDVPEGFTEVGSYTRRGNLGNVEEKVYRLGEEPNGTDGIKWSKETERTKRAYDTGISQTYIDKNGKENIMFIHTPIYEINNLAPIKINDYDISKTELKQKYKSYGSVTNENTGEDIILYTKTFDKNYKVKGLFGKIIPQIDEIIKTSRLSYSEKDSLGGTTRKDGTNHKEHRSFIGYGNYINKVEIDGKQYYVRFTVQREKNRSGLHSTFVSNIELYDTENLTKVASDPKLFVGGRLDFDKVSDAKLETYIELSKGLAKKDIQYKENAFFGNEKKENINRNLIHNAQEKQTVGDILGTSEIDIKDGVKFSVEGVEGAYNLDRYWDENKKKIVIPSKEYKKFEEGTRTANLKVAINMEKDGKDEKSIRIATGWEKGADGRWKYEEPEDFEFKDKINVNDLRKNATTPSLYDYLTPESYDKLSVLIDGKYHNMYRGPEVHISDRKIKDKEGNYVDTPDDYRWGYYMEPAHAGDRGDIYIYLGKKFYDPETGILNVTPEVKEVLLHEIQHHIQYEDGYKMPNANHTSLNDQFEVEARNVQNRMDLTPEERRNTLLSESQDVPFNEQRITESKIPWQEQSILNRANIDMRPPVEEIDFSKEAQHSQGWRKAYEELKENGESIRILQDTEERTIEEVAANTIAGNKLLWNDKGEGEWRTKGAQSELGWGQGEKKTFRGLWDDENGVSIAKLGEAVEQACRDLNIPYDENDANAGRNAILSVLHEVGAQGKPMQELKNYVENNRISEAYEAEKRFLEDRDEAFYEAYGMSYDDFAAKFPEIVRQKAPATEKEKAISWYKKRVQRQAEFVQQLQGQLDEARKLIKTTQEKVSAAEARLENAELEKQRAQAARDTQEGNAHRMYEAYVRANHAQNVLGQALSQRVTSEADAKLLAQMTKEQAEAFEKAYQTLQQTKSSMIDYVKENLSAEDMPFVTKSEINRLLSLIQKTNTPKQMEDAMNDVAGTVAKGQVRHLEYQLDKLLRMKTQDVNGRNMSVAKTVDNRTRRIMENLHGNVVNMEVSGLENRIDALYRARRLKAAEIAEAKANGGKYIVRDENGNTIAKSTSALQREWDSLSEQIADCAAKIDEARRKNVTDSESEVNERMEILEQKLSDATSGENHVEWTDKDTDEMVTLRAMQRINEHKKTERQIAQLHGKLQELYSARSIWNERLKNETTKEGKDKCRNEIRSIDADIRANQMEETAAQETLVDQLHQTIDVIQSMMENGRNILREQVDADIQHNMWLLRNAFNDVKGEHFDMTTAPTKKKQNPVRKLFNLPLSSFDYMLQKVGTRFFGKEGFLYRYLMSGHEGSMECHNEYIRGMEEQMGKLNAKVKEIFGRGNGIWGTDAWIKQKEQCEKVINHSGVYKINPHTGNREEIPLSKGQAMYIYMVNKQRDGKAKLEKQGFDDQSIQQCIDFMGEQYRQLADWVQDEFLPSTRAKYNERYNELYHTDMARIENYVPLKMSAKARIGENDAEGTQKNGGIQKADLRPGSLINRTFNTMPIDYSWNAFDVILDHVRKQESWYAYAKLRRDVDTICNSPYFREQLEANQVGMAQRFTDAAFAATEAYIAAPNELDATLAVFNKGLVAGNIAWRLNTALKQLLSAPAYLGYASNPVYAYYLGKNCLTGSMFYNWKWCYENIESFRERVNLGDLGDNRIAEKLDDKQTFQRWLQKYASAGMIPNRIIDGLTCSIGIKTIYDYRYKVECWKIDRDKSLTPEEREKALKEAHFKAKMDADIFYNETQQSSHPSFMSPLQMQTSMMARAMTTYQNSNLGYTRATLESFRDIVTALHYTKTKEAYTERFMEEDGMTREEAEKRARMHIFQNLGGSINRFVLFGWVMKYAWDLGSKGFLGLFSNDDDDKKRKKGETQEEYEKRTTMGLVNEALTYGITPWQGTPAGNMLMTLKNGIAGMSGNQQSTNSILLIDEMDALIKDCMDSYEDQGFSPMLGAVALNKLTRLGGVDLETWSNIVQGVTLMCKDGHHYEDWMLDVMLVLNTPKSGRSLAMKNIMKKEAEDGRIISPIEWAQKMALAERYVNEVNAVNQLMPWKRGEVTLKKAQEYKDQQYAAYHTDFIPEEPKKNNTQKWYDAATRLEDKLDDEKFKEECRKYEAVTQKYGKLQQDDKLNETDNAPDYKEKHENDFYGASVVSFYKSEISEAKKELTGDKEKDRKIVKKVNDLKAKCREALKDPEAGAEQITEIKAERKDR